MKPVLSGYSKNRQKSVLKGEDSLVQVLSTCIRLLSILKTFVFPIFKWTLKTGLAVLDLNQVVYIIILQCLEM